MSTRDDIAQALDGLTIVPDEPGAETIVITAYPQLPDSIQPYTAWPVWVSTDWRTACIADETWTVLLVLPQSSSDAWAQSRDAVEAPVRDALQKLGAVPRDEPLQLAVGDQAQTVPSIAFTLET